MIFENFIIGVVFGISAGFAPGPLLALVVSESIQHNIKAGIKVAFAPIITDLPIVIIPVLILTEFSNLNILLGIISIFGAFVIGYMGYENINIKGMEIVNAVEVKSNSLKKGILINVLSPHPYLFWFSVGAPIIIKSASQSLGAAIAFVSGFYIFLIGSKIFLAIIAGKAKVFLKGKTYINILKFLGFVLFIFAFLLLYEGVKLILSSS